jgi:hypothetical protein
MIELLALMLHFRKIRVRFLAWRLTVQRVFVISSVPQNQLPAEYIKLGQFITFPILSIFCGLFNDAASIWTAGSISSNGMMTDE